MKLLTYSVALIAFVSFTSVSFIACGDDSSGDEDGDRNSYESDCKDICDDAADCVDDDDLSSNEQDALDEVVDECKDACEDEAEAIEDAGCDDEGAELNECLQDADLCDFEDDLCEDELDAANDCVEDADSNGSGRGRVSGRGKPLGGSRNKVFSYARSRVYGAIRGGNR